MLDIKFIREHPGELKKSLQHRNVQFDVDYLLDLDQRRRAKTQEVDDFRAQQNDFAETIAKISDSERGEKIAASREVKEKLGHLEFELKTLEDEFGELMHRLPNIPDSQVPVGSSEKENVVVHEVGTKPQFSFAPKDHLTLGEELGIIDFAHGAKAAGSGFYYLKDEGALLELALVHYALGFLRKNGFTLWLTPELVRKKFYLGTGYLPAGPEAQTYEIQESDLGLIATAEVTLVALHADETLAQEALPLRYAGYSHCFRQEGGSYGKYSRGLYRVHQFTKVEMFAYTTPGDSGRMHDELLRLEEELWRGLGIPYRVLEMCTGDLGAMAARKFDLEAWMPGRNDWGEVTSASNTTDYQARNLNVRYKKPDGSHGFPHMLNGTAIATSRAIVAILENYQQEDGSIKIPEVLRPYMGEIEFIKKS